ncbi:MAG: GIDE domain-containing protein [Thiohalocapsa sp.]
MLEFFAQSAADADPVGFWIGSLFAAAATFYLVRLGLDAFWKLRLVLDTPTARIRSAPQGYVELQGQAHPQRALIPARLSGTPCVWYRYRIQERRRSTKHNDNWVTIEQGDAGRPFILDDGTGRCLVDPAGASLKCRSTDVWYDSGTRSGTGLGAFFGQQRRYRKTEERIAQLEYVYVLGHFETPRRGARERQQLTRHLLTQWKRDPERLRHFDRNGDGEIDLEEWDAARAKASQLAEQSEGRLSAEPPLSRVVKADDARQPFVVSTEDEQDLIARLRLHAFGGTLGGLLIGIGLAFALSARAIA